MIPLKGERYRIVAGVEGIRPHAIVENVIFRGSYRLRGAEYWAFESEFFFHLVQPEDVLELEHMKRRYDL